MIIIKEILDENMIFFFKSTQIILKFQKMNKINHQNGFKRNMKY